MVEKFEAGHIQDADATDGKLSIKRRMPNDGQSDMSSQVAEYDSNCWCANSSCPARDQGRGSRRFQQRREQTMLHYRRGTFLEERKSFSRIVFIIGSQSLLMSTRAQQPC